MSPIAGVLGVLPIGGMKGLEAPRGVAGSMPLRACRKAEANAWIEGKRSSGFLASARRITASIAGERRGFLRLGASGCVLTWAYIIRIGFPRKGGWPVSNS